VKRRTVENCAQTGAGGVVEDESRLALARVVAVVVVTGDCPG